MILASCSGVSVMLAAGTAVSPFGPVVLPADASAVDAASIAAAARASLSNAIGSWSCLPCGSGGEAAAGGSAARGVRPATSARRGSLCGGSRLSDCFQPSTTLSLVTVIAGATEKAGASLPISP